MPRGEYTNIVGRESTDIVGRSRGHGGHRGRAWGWGGRSWGGWHRPYYASYWPSYALPSYPLLNYAVPSYVDYALPSYVAPSYVDYALPSYVAPSYVVPSYAPPIYGAAAVPYWGSRRSLRRFARRHYMLGAE